LSGILTGSKDTSQDTFGRAGCALSTQERVVETEKGAKRLCDAVTSAGGEQKTVPKIVSSRVMYIFRGAGPSPVRMRLHAILTFTDLTEKSADIPKSGSKTSPVDGSDWLPRRKIPDEIPALAINDALAV
jgi:hypothetical protein